MEPNKAFRRKKNGDRKKKSGTRKWEKIRLRCKCGHTTATYLGKELHNTVICVHCGREGGHAVIVEGKKSISVSYMIQCRACGYVRALAVYNKAYWLNIAKYLQCRCGTNPPSWRQLCK